MKRKLLGSSVIFSMLASTFVIAAPIQRIDVVNTLWNPNATGGAQGLTPTAVTLSFNNGGAKPCFVITIPFDGATTAYAGTGQSCVAKISSVSIAPVAGAGGTVFAAPADVVINPAFFETQITLSDQTDPVFDTTNGSVKTQGVVKVTTQGDFKG